MNGMLKWIQKQIPGGVLERSSKRIPAGTFYGRWNRIHGSTPEETMKKLPGNTNTRVLKRVLVVVMTFLLYSGLSYATHNRAGEITFKHISGYTYEVTIATFTYTQSAANRSQLTVEWGDNTYSVAPLVQRTILPNYYYHNIYTATHTFPGPGIYEIMMQDPNRNYGIANIPNSVNVVFSIKTTFIISPDIGNNSTPLLLNFPIDRAARGHIFIHNAAAYDPDGDSLSYKLAICTGQDGQEISNYTFPAASDTFYVDPVLGDLVWYAPVDTGRYNVAMNIEEWRKGVKIGNIVRDMQIDVVESDNNPPENPPLEDFCVIAGELIEFQVTTVDEDGDSIKQTILGGPFEQDVSPATYQTIASGLGFITSDFSWQTDCDHIRKQPYQVVVRSQDNNKDVNLVDIDNFNIRIIGPAPEDLQASATSTEIELAWNRSDCGPVRGYFLYRREGSYGFTPDSCEYGVPAYTGFERIAVLNGRDDTVYVDDNKGEGLIQGVEYCYMVTAFYDDEYESLASGEVCSALVPGFPSILNVSVTKVDLADGNIFLAWAKPDAADLTGAPGPYVFQVFRSATYDMEDMVLIDSVLTSDLDDTTYVDVLNTVDFPYYYSVKMFNNTPGNRFQLRPGEQEIASSLYIEITPDDNQLTLDIRKKAPWINDTYIIYRQNSALEFVPIDTSNSNVYVDTGLKNGETYVYQVESQGWRPIKGVVFTNSNFSHLNIGTPVDITPPCPPVLYVVSQCDSFMNVLTWTNPNRTCADDVIRYNIYYTGDLQSPLDSIAYTAPATDTVFYHRFTEGTLMAGCYAVTAVDSFENESDFSVRICVDECVSYELPNVFSPNGDNINDVFVAKNLSKAIEKVDMKIYNRYGQLVYETSDPAINWNGYYRNTSNKVASGVYYYICDVYEPRITGVEVRSIVGFIHLYGEGYSEEVTK
ncbi:MAG: gliding motility-associated C-terminal domain-containing protein [Bacteroidales bacterium]|nr:gliding motility-associated C-terminal domain-containing protein [Bacteroidales bacterium]